MNTEILMLVITGSSVIVAIVSTVVGTRLASKARTAAERSADAAEEANTFVERSAREARRAADAAEGAVEIERQRLREERRPRIDASYRPGPEQGGVRMDGFDLSSESDLEDLVVTLTEPNAHEPYVLEAIALLDGGSSGRLGEGLRVGDLRAGRPVRFTGQRSGAKGGQVNLACDCRVGKEEYHVLVSFEWPSPATVHSPVGRRISRGR